MAFKFPKTAGGAIGLVFRILGITVVASPAITAVSSDVQSGDWAHFPSHVLYNYTGYDVTPGKQGINLAQTGVGIASIAGGIVLIKLGSIVAKMVR